MKSSSLFTCTEKTKHVLLKTPQLLITYAMWDWLSHGYHLPSHVLPIIISDTDVPSFSDDNSSDISFGLPLSLFPLIFPVVTTLFSAFHDVYNVG